MGIIIKSFRFLELTTKRLYLSISVVSRPRPEPMLKTVTMDLNFYYQDIVRVCFPNAQVVIDRFHMVQMITRSFNSLRVKVIKTFDKRSRQYQLLKSPWKLYLKKYDELEKVHPHYNWHYKDCLTQTQVVMEGILR